MMNEWEDPEFWSAAKLKAACEEGFEIGEGTSMRWAVTGEPYVTIGSQLGSLPAEPGTVDEGAPRELAFDQETAYVLALSCFKTYAEGRVGKLYWRWGPTFETFPEERRCRFYLRCLISDKPPLPKDHPRVKSYWDDMAEKAGA
jgi:hypothetical protein